MTLSSRLRPARYSRAPHLPRPAMELTRSYVRRRFRACGHPLPALAASGSAAGPNPDTAGNPTVPGSSHAGDDAPSLPAGGMPAGRPTTHVPPYQEGLTAPHGGQNLPTPISAADAEEQVWSCAFASMLRRLLYMLCIRGGGALLACVQDAFAGALEVIIVESLQDGLYVDRSKCERPCGHVCAIRLPDHPCNL